MSTTAQKSIRFDNTYTRLPGHFYAELDAAKASSPELIKFNRHLAEDLGIPVEDFSENELAEIFSGNQQLEGMQPVALAYAGHQFGNFVPQLGDGRALLLGEVIASDNKHYDIQLKGSGRTPFSRGGDGRAAIGPVLREYLVSEAMHALNVPTTRSLAAVTTGDKVYRQSALPGAVLTRVAQSHIRVGTFEYFAFRRDTDAIRQLADYTINRHYSEIENDDNKYLSFLKSVGAKQAELIARWNSIGFIHGVMNTDNTAISGETIDYGPCAFIDEFNYNKVFSSIDHGGRYAYNNQGPILLWNLSRLAECLIPLVDENQSKAIDLIKEKLNRVAELIDSERLKFMAPKLGLKNISAEDDKLIEEFLNYLQKEELDFTLSFRHLTAYLPGAQADVEYPLKEDRQFKKFLKNWQRRLESQNEEIDSVKERMNSVNPVVIPRNHLIEELIHYAEQNDYSYFEEMLKVVKEPFKQPVSDKYTRPPEPEEKVTATFCGT